MATLPELTILGFDLNNNFDILRRKLIGSSTVPKGLLNMDEKWGTTCNSFLNSVQKHESKASATYYYKNHVQYFKSIYDSINELTRISKIGGKCVIVVQDSYYKNIHNNLAQIFTEMFQNNGHSLLHRKDFLNGATMGLIHPESKKYKMSQKPIESVLCFVKNN
jgi:hypothetical protein